MKTTKKFAIVLLLLALFATACGSDDETPGATDTPSKTPPSSEAPPEEPSEEPVEFKKVEIWLAREDGVSVTFRHIPSETKIGTAVMEQLLLEPSPGEKDAGLSTLIPDGTQLLGLTINDGLATVDLSSEFGSGGGSASVLGRVAQVVYTLTQFSTVDSVAFEIDGEPVEALGGEGLILDGPQTRKAYKDELHPIQVYSPVVGDELTSPITVSGTANVFEATVSLRLVTESGEVLAEDFTTATCGTGCVGDFETSIKFDIDGDTPAYLEVFESSAEDGSQIHIAEDPAGPVPVEI